MLDRTKMRKATPGGTLRPYAVFLEEKCFSDLSFSNMFEKQLFIRRVLECHSKHTLVLPLRSTTRTICMVLVVPAVNIQIVVCLLQSKSVYFEMLASMLIFICAYEQQEHVHVTAGTCRSSLFDFILQDPAELN